MSYALMIDGAWVEIVGHTVELPDHVVSQAWVETLDNDERAELGFVAVAETDPPAGAKILGSGVADADGVPTRTWQVEAYDAGELAAMKAQLTARLWAESERRVLAIMPESEQRAALGLGIEMITTIGVDPTAWPDADRAAYAQVLAAWTLIKAVRAARDAIVAALPSDAAGLATVDVAANPAWPA
ncbi:MAG: hypothetical protein JF588_11520 [Caulobacterales bacterium]|nr:hypothetical protein [Caulobacterales bacterium]